MFNNRLYSSARTGVALAATAFLAIACGDSNSPGAVYPVTFRIAAQNVSARAAGVAPAPLTISSVRLVAGAAALGNGDQFGCVDCEDSGPESSVQQLLDLPATGGAVMVSTEQVRAGRYAEVEISVERASGAVASAMQSWPAGSTIQIAGSHNGAPFVLYLAIVGSFRERLVPAVDVSPSSASSAVPVTITLPVASWFTSNGASLDPAVAADRAQIERNASASFAAPEAHGGQE